jgi:hypothetical protein
VRDALCTYTILAHCSSTLHQPTKSHVKTSSSPTYKSLHIFINFTLKNKFPIWSLEMNFGLGHIKLYHVLKGLYSTGLPTSCPKVCTSTDIPCLGLPIENPDYSSPWWASNTSWQHISHPSHLAGTYQMPWRLASALSPNVYNKPWKQLSFPVTLPKS